jgi:hypothetical protein
MLRHPLKRLASDHPILPTTTQLHWAVFSRRYCYHSGRFERRLHSPLLEKSG